MIRKLLPAILLGIAAPTSAAGAADRESVTFVLGEDPPSRPPLFRLATEVFRTDPQERTDHLRTCARSLREVRQSQVPRRNRGVLEGLARSAPRHGGDAYSYEDAVRVTYTVVYPGGNRPGVQPGGVQFRWLHSQEALRCMLARQGFGFGQFEWTVSPVQVKTGEVEVPALRAVGEGRVVHLLRTLVATGPGPEPQFAWEDPRFYTASR